MLVVPCRQDGYALLFHAFDLLGLTCVVPRQIMYRSEAVRQDRIHLRVPLHWLWYLCEEVSIDATLSF